MNIVILGCGRTGARIATLLEKAGHTISILDQTSEAFQRLPSDFHGKTMVGNGIDEDMLRRAGIQEAGAFIAVTQGDNRNIMASQIAKTLFNVRIVACRIYDPYRAEALSRLGIEVYSATKVITDLFLEALGG